MIRTTPRFKGLLAACCLVAVLPAQAACTLADEPRASLVDWKASGFAMVGPVGRQERALVLVECLGAADPFLRDGIAFEALSAWMRGKQLDAHALRALQQRLQSQLDGPDTEGFRKPFAALVLSEVARTDRVQPWMTAGERSRMATTAAAYLSSVRDYRGYVDGEGWRHGIAHGADWVLQLVLNKALQPTDAWTLLDALAVQVAPADGHAHAFGEPARLARAVAYAVARGDLEQPAVDAWLARLASSLGSRPQADPQAAWWARRANLENFLHALAYLAAGDQSAALGGLSTSTRAALERLP